MAFTVVTLTGTFQNADGTPADGTVQFQLTQPMANGDVIIETTPLAVILNASGGFSVPLRANDDTATLPVGTQYVVIERVTSTSNREYAITIPHAAVGGTVDLSTLMPTSPPGIG